MAIVDGGNEYLKPRNIGLLFFSDKPDKFFPYTQIDVVYFPEGDAGDQIQERIFKGPIQQQLQDALRYIRNNFITEKVIKLPDRAEARRFFNYPFIAIEEALVNAVYHRSYETREPVEVRIHPDKIEILSFPGPDPSISLAVLKSERITTRRYRNRRIGEFLKELKFTEGRGTGMPKIYRALAYNGSPLPQIDTNDERTHFLITIPMHPEMLPVSVKEQVYDEVYDKAPFDLSESELKILRLIRNNTVHRNTILEGFGYKVMTSNIKSALDKLLRHKLIAYTIPDKLRSKKQQYRITQLGITYLIELEKNDITI